MKGTANTSGKKGRKSVGIVIDVAMAVTLVATMATALIQEAPHEYLGVALFVLMAAHIVSKRRWLASVFREKHSALRMLQIAAIAGLALCFAGQIASSLVLSKHAFGFLPALPGAAWARRTHMICSYWMFVLSFAHAGLHARIPKSLPSRQTWAIRIVCIAFSCYGAYSFVKLNLWSYLTAQVQFAFADFNVPLALVFARYASVAVLVAVVFRCVREALLASGRSKKDAGQPRA